jgi:hypothetical protein
VSVTGTPLADFAKLQVYINVNSGPAQIKRVKLELGAVSTLAVDPPADFGEELRKCQRYYYKTTADSFAFGAHYGASTSTPVFIPLPVTLRDSPALNVTAYGSLYYSSSVINPTNVSVRHVEPNGVALQLTHPSIAANTTVVWKEFVVEMSADL